MRLTDWIYGRFENWLAPFEEPANLQPPEKLWAFIWHYARQAKGPFLLMLLTGGLTPLIDAGMFFFVGRLVDILSSLGPQRSWAALWAHSGPELSFMLFTVIVGRTLVLFGAALVDEQTIAPAFYNMVRWQSHRHVSRQSYQFFQDELAGSIANKVWQNGQAAGDLLESLIAVIWFMVIYTCTTLGTLATLDYRLAVLVAIWILGFAFLARRFLPTIRKQAEAAAEAGSAASGRIVDGYANIETLKLFAADGRDRFTRAGFERYLDAYTLFTRTLTSVRTSLTLLSGAMIVAIAWVSVDLWIKAVITIGAVTYTLGIVLRLNMLLARLMTQLNSILRTLGILENAKELIARPLGLVDQPGAGAMHVTRGEIRVEDVTFAYGDRDPVLRGINLLVRPGEKVGLIGASGSGKSTLINLILRLYDLDGGRILVDGQDVATVTQDSLRSQIGVVTQNTALLHRLLRSNIKLGKPDATDEEMIAAAEEAEADGFIATLVDNKGRRGYDAVVGERGVKLSGGQRQRIAIARVFLKDAPILILDEATSALDSEVEAAIQQNLDKLMRGKTVIAVAHRLSTIAHLDRLVVLADGRIVEDGTHDELVALGGIYARLWKRQSGGFLYHEKQEDQEKQEEPLGGRAAE